MSGESCQELNNSGATLDYFPALLRSTFPHYSGVHSCATPVCVPTLLWSILLRYSSPPLDWTGLHSACLSTGLAPDLTWEVVSFTCHLCTYFSSFILTSSKLVSSPYILTPTHFHLSHLCLTLAVAEVCTSLTYFFTTYLLY